MAKILIVYSSRTGNTKAIAELIAEGVRFTGNQAKLVDVKDIKKEADLEDCDGLIIGSATYHGDMMQSMKTMLFLAEKADLEGKAGGSFGAFEWSGEAPDRIFETMKNIFKMDMVKGPMLLKNADLGGGIKMAQDYGKETAEKLG